MRHYIAIPQKKKKISLYRSILSSLISLPIVLVLISNSIIVLSTKKYIYGDISTIPNKEVGLVLGAKAYGNIISFVLRDRVNGGIALKNQGKVGVLLLSGDHGTKGYDEVNTMKNFVLRTAPQIEKEAIFLDHAGFDTYDSIYRAKEVFCCTSMVVVTQRFHVARAVFFARSLGIDAVGYGVSEQNYSKKIRLKWQAREVLSRVKGIFSVVLRSKPKFLGEKIPVTGDGRKSWD